MRRTPVRKDPGSVGGASKYSGTSPVPTPSKRNQAMYHASLSSDELIKVIFRVSETFEDPNSSNLSIALAIKCLYDFLRELSPMPNMFKIVKETLETSIIPFLCDVLFRYIVRYTSVGTFNAALVVKYENIGSSAIQFHANSNVVCQILWIMMCISNENTYSISQLTRHHFVDMVVYIVLESEDVRVVEHCIWVLGNIGGDIELGREEVIYCGAIEAICYRLSRELGLLGYFPFGSGHSRAFHQITQFCKDGRNVPTPTTLDPTVQVYSPPQGISRCSTPTSTTSPSIKAGRASFSELEEIEDSESLAAQAANMLASYAPYAKGDMRNQHHTHSSRGSVIDSDSDSDNDYDLDDDSDSDSVMQGSLLSSVSDVFVQYRATPYPIALRASPTTPSPNVSTNNNNNNNSSVTNASSEPSAQTPATALPTSNINTGTMEVQESSEPMLTHVLRFAPTALTAKAITDNKGVCTSPLHATAVVHVSLWALFSICEKQGMALIDPLFIQSVLIPLLNVCLDIPDPMVLNHVASIVTYIADSSPKNTRSLISSSRCIVSPVGFYIASTQAQASSVVSSELGIKLPPHNSTTTTTSDTDSSDAAKIQHAGNADLSGASNTRTLPSDLADNLSQRFRKCTLYSGLWQSAPVSQCEDRTISDSSIPSTSSAALMQTWRNNYQYSISFVPRLEDTQTPENTATSNAANPSTCTTSTSAAPGAAVSTPTTASMCHASSMPPTPPAVPDYLAHMNAPPPEMAATLRQTLQHIAKLEQWFETHSPLSDSLEVVQHDLRSVHAFATRFDTLYVIDSITHPETGTTLASGSAHDSSSPPLVHIQSRLTKTALSRLRVLANLLLLDHSLASQAHCKERWQREPLQAGVDKIQHLLSQPTLTILKSLSDAEALLSSNSTPTTAAVDAKCAPSCDATHPSTTSTSSISPSTPAPEFTPFRPLPPLDPVPAGLVAAFPPLPTAPLPAQRRSAPTSAPSLADHVPPAPVSAPTTSTLASRSTSAKNTSNPTTMPTDTIPQIVLPSIASKLVRLLRHNDSLVLDPTIRCIGNIVCEDADMFYHDDWENEYGDDCSASFSASSQDLQSSHSAQEARGCDLIVEMTVSEKSSESKADDTCEQRIQNVSTKTMEQKGNGNCDVVGNTDKEDRMDTQSSGVCSERHNGGYYPSSLFSEQDRASLLSVWKSLSVSSPKCAIYDVYTHRVVRMGAVPLLRRLMDHDSPSIWRETCWTLSNIAAGGREYIPQIVASGCVHKCLEFYSATPSDRSVRTEASWVLLNVASGTTSDELFAMLSHKELALLGHMTLDLQSPSISSVSLQLLHRLLAHVWNLNQKLRLQSTYLQYRLPLVMLYSRLSSGTFCCVGCDCIPPYPTTSNSTSNSSGSGSTTSTSTTAHTAHSTTGTATTSCSTAGYPYPLTPADSVTALPGITKTQTALATGEPPTQDLVLRTLSEVYTTVLSSSILQAGNSLANLFITIKNLLIRNSMALVHTFETIPYQSHTGFGIPPNSVHAAHSLASNASGTENDAPRFSFSYHQGQLQFHTHNHTHSAHGHHLISGLHCPRCCLDVPTNRKKAKKSTIALDAFVGSVHLPHIHTWYTSSGGGKHAKKSMEDLTRMNRALGSFFSKIVVEQELPHPPLPDPTCFLDILSYHLYLILIAVQEHIVQNSDLHRLLESLIQCSPLPLTVANPFQPLASAPCAAVDANGAEAKGPADRAASTSRAEASGAADLTASTTLVTGSSSNRLMRAGKHCQTKKTIELLLHSNFEGCALCHRTWNKATQATKVCPECKVTVCAHCSCAQFHLDVALSVLSYLGDSSPKPKSKGKNKAKSKKNKNKSKSKEDRDKSEKDEEEVGNTDAEATTREKSHSLDSLGSVSVSSVGDGVSDQAIEPADATAVAAASASTSVENASDAVESNIASTKNNIDDAATHLDDDDDVDVFAFTQFGRASSKNSAAPVFEKPFRVIAARTRKDSVSSVASATASSSASFATGASHSTSHVVLEGHGDNRYPVQRGNADGSISSNAAPYTDSTPSRSGVNSLTASTSATTLCTNNASSDQGDSWQVVSRRSTKRSNAASGANAGAGHSTWNKDPSEDKSSGAGASRDKKGGANAPARRGPGGKQLKNPSSATSSPRFRALKEPDSSAMDSIPSLSSVQTASSSTATSAAHGHRGQLDPHQRSAFAWGSKGRDAGPSASNAPASIAPVASATVGAAGAIGDANARSAVPSATKDQPQKPTADSVWKQPHRLQTIKITTTPGSTTASSTASTTGGTNPIAGASGISASGPSAPVASGVVKKATKGPAWTGSLPTAVKAVSGDAAPGSGVSHSTRDEREYRDDRTRGGKGRVFLPHMRGNNSSSYGYSNTHYSSPSYSGSYGDGGYILLPNYRTMSLFLHVLDSLLQVCPQSSLDSLSATSRYILTDARALLNKRAPNGKFLLDEATIGCEDVAFVIDEIGRIPLPPNWETLPAQLAQKRQAEAMASSHSSSQHASSSSASANTSPTTSAANTSSTGNGGVHAIHSPKHHPTSAPGLSGGERTPSQPNASTPKKLHPLLIHEKAAPSATGVGGANTPASGSTSGSGRPLSTGSVPGSGVAEPAPLAFPLDFSLQDCETPMLALALLHNSPDITAPSLFAHLRHVTSSARVILDPDSVPGAAGTFRNPLFGGKDSDPLQQNSHTVSPSQFRSLIAGLESSSFLKPVVLPETRSGPSNITNTAAGDNTSSYLGKTDFANANAFSTSIVFDAINAGAERPTSSLPQVSSASTSTSGTVALDEVPIATIAAAGSSHPSTFNATSATTATTTASLDTSLPASPSKASHMVPPSLMITSTSGMPAAGSPTPPPSYGSPYSPPYLSPWYRPATDPSNGFPSPALGTNTASRLEPEMAFREGRSLSFSLPTIDPSDDSVSTELERAADAARNTSGADGSASATERNSSAMTKEQEYAVTVAAFAKQRRAESDRKKEQKRKELKRKKRKLLSISAIKGGSIEKSDLASLLTPRSTSSSFGPDDEGRRIRRKRKIKGTKKAVDKEEGEDANTEPYERKKEEGDEDDDDDDEVEGDANVEEDEEEDGADSTDEEEDEDEEDGDDSSSSASDFSDSSSSEVEKDSKDALNSATSFPYRGRTYHKPFYSSPLSPNQYMSKPLFRTRFMSHKASQGLLRVVQNRYLQTNIAPSATAPATSPPLPSYLDSNTLGLLSSRPLTSSPLAASPGSTSLSTSLNHSPLSSALSSPLSSPNLSPVPLSHSPGSSPSSSPPPIHSGPVDAALGVTAITASLDTGLPKPAPIHIVPFMNPLRIRTPTTAPTATVPAFASAFPSESSSFAAGTSGHVAEGEDISSEDSAPQTPLTRSFMDILAKQKRQQTSTSPLSRYLSSPTNKSNTPEDSFSSTAIASAPNVGESLLQPIKYEQSTHSLGSSELTSLSQDVVSMAVHPTGVDSEEATSAISRFAEKTQGGDRQEGESSIAGTTELNLHSAIALSSTVPFVPESLPSRGLVQRSSSISTIKDDNRRALNDASGLPDGTNASSVDSSSDAQNDSTTSRSEQHCSHSDDISLLDTSSVNNDPNVSIDSSATDTTLDFIVLPETSAPPSPGKYVQSTFASSSFSSPFMFTSADFPIADMSTLPDITDPQHRTSSTVGLNPTPLPSEVLAGHTFSAAAAAAPTDSSPYGSPYGSPYASPYSSPYFTSRLPPALRAIEPLLTTEEVEELEEEFEEEYAEYELLRAAVDTSSRFLDDEHN